MPVQHRVQTVLGLGPNPDQVVPNGNERANLAHRQRRHPDVALVLLELALQRQAGQRLTIAQIGLGAIVHLGVDRRWVRNLDLAGQRQEQFVDKIRVGRHLKDDGVAFCQVLVRPGWKLFCKLQILSCRASDAPRNSASALWICRV